MNSNVNLRLIAENINLPTVIKTAILPRETKERLFVATQTGEILYSDNGKMKVFLDIKNRIIKLSNYDERGLVGLAFHLKFNTNGVFYMHYALKDSEGEKTLSDSFKPNPCDLSTMNLKWTNRNIKYDHIDTVEEWILKSNGKIIKNRTLLNLKRPFLNHNGVNSLNFSPESGNLVLTTGDGGDGFDPFNLSQDDMEIAGKIIEINISDFPYRDNIPVVSRFDELPDDISESLTIIAKGVRNISGITYLKFNNTYIKSIGNVGQNLVESIYSFISYTPVPVIKLKDKSFRKNLDNERFINFGWRAWEGNMPTSVIRTCSMNSDLSDKIISYYDEVIKTSGKVLPPLISYYHKEYRPDKLKGTAITGVQAYTGNEIKELSNSIVFIDLSNKNENPVKGALGYVKIKTNGKPVDYDIIKVNYDFKEPAFYVSLGTNFNQTKLFLGVYSSTKVNDLKKGKIFEIIP